MNDDVQNVEARDSVTLSQPDADALDRLLGDRPPAPEGGAAETDASADARRAARVRGWLNVLAMGAVPDAPADLADRTLALIERERMRLQPATTAAGGDPFATPFRRRWSRRVAEVAAMAVAAMLLMTVVLLGVGQARQSKARIACDENLQKWAMAFATYANTNSNELPSLAMPADRNWLKTSDAGAGVAQSNSANLVPLISANLVSCANLYCAGSPPKTVVTSASNDLGTIGYSYTYMYGPVKPHWDANHETIILADRNPMFLPGAVVSAALQNSANHGGHGNYVLRGDGQATWETSPDAGPHSDNIWTVDRGAQVLTTYAGTEATASAVDAFVCP